MRLAFSFDETSRNQSKADQLKKEQTIELKPVLKRPDGMVQQTEKVHVSNVYQQIESRFVD